MKVASPFRNLGSKFITHYTVTEDKLYAAGLQISTNIAWEKRLFEMNQKKVKLEMNEIK